MDFQFIFNAIIGIGGLVGPFICKVILDRIAEAKQAGIDRAEQAEKIAAEAKALAIAITTQFNAFQVHVADHYVKNSRLEQMEERVMGALTRIESKLDSKQDKA